MNNFYTKFENISSDFILTRILTKLKKNPDHSGKQWLASANYPNPQIKDLKTDTAYIQISDTGNFKATLDVFLYHNDCEFYFSIVQRQFTEL